MTRTLTTSQGTISVGPAITDEAALVRELRLEELSNHPEAFTYDLTVARGEGVEFWAERIRNYEREQSGAIMVARSGEQLVGIAGIVRADRPKTRHNASIWGVYVRPEWRGYHVAEALIVECLAWAQAQKLVLVKLEVISANTAAIRCYTRCGFTVYGVDPQVIFSDGVYYDELMMVKRVQS
jgi:ribosomal protein S18 acetylase RimI-like enzyme